MNKLSLLITFWIWLIGCSGDPSTTAPVDVEDVTGTVDSGSADIGLMDAGERTDGGDTGTARSPWMNAESFECEEGTSTITYPQPPDFPEFPSGTTFGGLVSKNALLEEGDFPEFGAELRVKESRKAFGIGGLGWLVSGDTNLTLSIGFYTDKVLNSSSRFTATALVDYQPVDATWRVVGSEDGEFESETIASGIARPFNEAVEVLVVEIPYESFEEHGYHELAVVINTASSPNFLGILTNRFGIWNQSTHRLPHPCFEQVMVSEIRAREDEEPSPNYGRPHVWPIINSPVTEGDYFEDGVEMFVGDSLDLSYLVRGPNSGYPAAFAPTINGEPATPPSLINTERAVWTADLKQIVYRENFTFRPNAPGEYILSAVMVNNAFVAEVSPDGIISNPTGFSDLNESGHLRVTVLPNE